MIYFGTELQFLTRLFQNANRATKFANQIKVRNPFSYQKWLMHFFWEVLFS